MQTCKLNKTDISDKIEREIKRRNQIFKKATKAQKRVLIAKDVIKQIEAKKFKATQGEYVLSPRIQHQIDKSWMHYDEERYLKSKSLQKEFLRPQTKCQVCGIGSLMVSCTLFNNAHTFKDYEEIFGSLGVAINNSDSFENGFLDLFSKEQLALIETAFEGSSCIRVDISDDQIEKAWDFAQKYTNPRKKLIGIMKNIISNNGIFKP